MSFGCGRGATNSASVIFIIETIVLVVLLLQMFFLFVLFVPWRTSPSSDGGPEWLDGSGSSGVCRG